MKENFKKLLANVTCFVLDMDGVLTDGTLLVTKQDGWQRSMHIRDGYALVLASRKGYKTMLISGSTAPGVDDRMRKLGFCEVLLEVKDKASTLKELMEKHELKAGNIMYMGDDMPDIEAMQLCGVPVCPADAVHQVKAISLYVSINPGGHGAVRDVVEQVLTLKGQWE